MIRLGTRIESVSPWRGGVPECSRRSAGQLLVFRSLNEKFGGAPKGNIQRHAWQKFDCTVVHSAFSQMSGALRDEYRLTAYVLGLTSLQQRLIKTGGRLIRHARYFVLQLAESQQAAESHLTSTLFPQILGRIERLAWHPT